MMEFVFDDRSSSAVIMGNHRVVRGKIHCFVFFFCVFRDGRLLVCISSVVFVDDRRVYRETVDARARTDARTISVQSDGETHQARDSSSASFAILENRAEQRQSAV